MSEIKQDNITSVISSEIDYLLKRSRKVSETFHHFKKIDNKPYQYDISSWNYVFSLYQAIERMHTRQYVINFPNPSLLEILYIESVKNPMKICSGHIELHNDNFMQMNEKFFQYNTDIFLFRDFLQQFNSRIENCELSNLNIDIRTVFQGADASHRNTIFIHKNKQGNIFLVWFEPHGFTLNHDFQIDIHNKVRNFLNYLIERYRLTYGKHISLIEKNITCPTGLQHYEPGQGYCVMYSYFWLFVTLKCFSVLIENSLPFNTEETIGKIENEIIRIARQKKLPIYKLIHSFAIFLVNAYMERLFLKYPHLVKTVLANIRIQTHTNVDDNKIKVSEMSKSSSREKRSEEKKAVKGNRKKDGQVCADNDDCLSDLCIDNVCLNREQYLRKYPPKNDNMSCTEDWECKSGLCKLGRCRKYIQRPNLKCKKNDECESDLCLDGYCQLWADRNEGENCLEDSECISNLCIDGKCLSGNEYGNYYPLKGVGEKCFRSYECISEACDDNICSDREPL